MHKLFNSIRYRGDDLWIKDKKNWERNTIISVVVMIAILVVGSIALKSLLAPKDNTITIRQLMIVIMLQVTLKMVHTAESAEPSNGYTGVYYGSCWRYNYFFSLWFS